MFFNQLPAKLRSQHFYSQDHQGILFLTANKVGKIDRVFKSRIHVRLLYKKLDEARTVKIWENNITRVDRELTSDGRRIQCRRMDIIDFAKKHYEELEESDDFIVWNGRYVSSLITSFITACKVRRAEKCTRQIRNAFQTVIAIAAYEQAINIEGTKQDMKPASTGKDEVILESAQFGKVAKSAKEFDRYLKQVTLFTDSDMAKSRCNRDDVYTEEEKETHKRDRKRRKRRKGGRRESSSEEHSSSSSGSDRRQRKKRKK